MRIIIVILFDLAVIVGTPLGYGTVIQTYFSLPHEVRTRMYMYTYVNNRLRVCIITILYHTILYYTILYYTILYYTILYYTILYYTILYYTILYYTILYCTILDQTILYYIISQTGLSYHSILHYTIRLKSFLIFTTIRVYCDGFYLFLKLTALRHSHVHLTRLSQLGVRQQTKWGGTVTGQERHLRNRSTSKIGSGQEDIEELQ